MNKLFLLCIFSMSSCVTSSTLMEPERTSFYVQCLSSGVPMENCECLESNTVKTSGITNPKTNEEAQRFVATLKMIVANGECTPKGKMTYEQRPL